LALVGLAVLPSAAVAGPVPLPASTVDSLDVNSSADDLADLPACPEDDAEVGAVDSRVRVAKINGLIDPVVKDYVLRSLADAEADPDALGLILWMDSTGSVLSDADYQALAGALQRASLPVALWVGQPGSTARGGAAELAAVVDVIAVTPNSTIGQIDNPRLSNAWDPDQVAVAEAMETELLTADEALAQGLSVGPLADVATLGPFAASLQGFEVFQCLDPDDNLRTIPRSQVQMSALGVTGQLFHTVASPEVAYLFLALGLALLVFELYTAGIGIAGVLGAGFLALSSYGLVVLPTRWWALGLLLLAFLAFAVDIQTNVPRFYTMVGLVLYTVASWFLFDGIRIAWITLFAGIVGAILYVYSGMPSMVRTRFSTPTIGRKWMIGEMGEALTDVDPDGTVTIRDVNWRASVNRATPVKAGDRIRVVGLDKLVLEIEPEEGGARDYRDRS
jgi:membrane-bound serine protease (ClpP class)